MKKAPGPDKITSEHLQHLYGEIQSHIFMIFDTCIKMSYFPVKWKLAQVLVLPKPNKEDYTDPSPYRPKSLLSVLGKTLEGILLVRLQDLGTTQNWVNKNQHGFRNVLSTITAIDSLKKAIQHGYHCKAYTACVLLDIKGAYDNAWHDVITRNLALKNAQAILSK